MWYTRLDLEQKKNSVEKLETQIKCVSLDNSNMLLVLLKVSQVMQDVTLEKTRLKKKKKTSWRAHRNSVYHVCHFYANLKLFHNKKFI